MQIEMLQLVALVRNGVSGFLDWWRSELAGLVPRALQPARRRRRRLLLLALGRGEVELFRGGGADGRLIGRAASGDAEALEQLVRKARARKRPAALRLAPEHGLRKTIELPLAAKEDLDQLLRFEMDRLTPFRAEEVRFAHRIIHTEPRSRRMQVELQLAPKTAVEDALGTAKAAGLVPVSVELGGPDGSTDDALDLLPGDPATRGGTNRLSRALAVLALLLAAAAVAIPLRERHSTAAALEAEAAAAKVEAEESLALREQLEQVSTSTDLLAAEKSRVPLVSQVLAEVTRVLPDQAYLARLDWRDGTLQLEGYAEGAAALIGLLDRSPLFQTPQFRSPVTPDRRTGLERFHVSLELAAEGS